MDNDVICSKCGAQLHVGDFPFCHGNPSEHSRSSPGVVGDDIPGGILIKHAVCNPDGSPRRFYSKSDIKRAANEVGYTITGDTPKPYRVSWSGKQNRLDGLKSDG